MVFEIFFLHLIFHPIHQNQITNIFSLCMLLALVGQVWEEYLGIPYAAPPVGVLRWKKTKPAKSWEGILDATKFGSICLQNGAPNVHFPVIGSQNEDCLFLNIYVPSGVRYVR